MTYFKNYIQDAVVREDSSGKRFVKTLDNLNERLAKRGSLTAYGGESFGTFSILVPITKKEYDTFGVLWTFGETETEIKKL